MARIFLDLDGVLADFDKGVLSFLGMSPKDFVQVHGERVFWKRLEALPAFYSRLEWMWGAPEMVAEIRSLAQAHGDLVFVLTGLPLGDWAAPQKRVWCYRELDGLPVICCMSRDKAKYCNLGDLLIDDREEAGVPWREAGGIFIHHTDPAASLAQVVAHYG
jgi:hypothetical protein